MAKLRFKKNGTPFIDFRVSGKRHRPEFLTRKDAEKFLNLADADPNEALAYWLEGSGATAVYLKDRVETFKKEHCATRVRGSEMDHHLDRMSDFLKERFSIDAIEISVIQGRDLKAFQDHLKGTLAAASVNRYFSTIKTFFKDLFEREITAVNLSDLVSTLDVQTQKREAISLDEIKKLAVMLGTRGADQVLIDVVKSMEVSPFGPIDFARLRWRDIDFEVGEINTTRMKGKGQRDWHVPLIFGYHKLLREIRSRQMTNGFGRPGDYVYLDRKWRSINPGWVSKSLQRAREAAGIEHVPYTSRHRIITELAKKTNRDLASQFAGHGSVKTTEDFYLVGGNEDFRNRVKDALE